MGEDLNLNGGIGADVGDLVPGQLPGEDHAGHALVRAELHAVQVVDAHLGGGVDRHIRGHLAEHPEHPQVLDQHGVHPEAAALLGHLGRGGELPVGEQGIQRQIDLHAPEMAVRNRRRKFLRGEILRVAAGVKVSVSKIDGVRAGLNRGGYRLGRSGGREEF